MNLQDKNILITGSTGGIGSAIAEALADQGAHVMITGRNTVKLYHILSRLNGDGHKSVTADIATSAGRKAILEEAKQFKVDVLINNAGVNHLAMLNDMSDQQIDTLAQVNLISPILLCRDLAPLIAQSSEGAIINIGSILGSIGYPGSSVYCASKFGLRGFTEALRRELADTSIKVVYFAPRATNTPLNTEQMNQLNAELGNPVDSPEVVAQQLIKALKHNAQNYYLGRPEAFFVKLNSLLPRLVDKSLFKQLPIIQKFASPQH